MRNEPSTEFNAVEHKKYKSPTNIQISGPAYFEKKIKKAVSLIPTPAGVIGKIDINMVIGKILITVKYDMFISKLIKKIHTWKDPIIQFNKE